MDNNLPKDASAQVMQITPAVVALARTVDASISSTNLLRVYAITQDVYLKWGTDDVTASNFDEVIPAGQMVDLAVPRQSSGLLYTAVNLIERTASATAIVIEK